MVAFVFLAAFLLDSVDSTDVSMCDDPDWEVTFHDGFDGPSLNDVSEQDRQTISLHHTFILAISLH